MIDALIKRVSVTYKCYEMYEHRPGGKRCNCSCFEIDLEMDAILLIAYGESEVKLFAWYDKLFNLKYLPLFHHFKAIYQFPKHIIFLIKIVANASLTIFIPQYNNSFLHFRLASPLHRQSWWVKPALVQVGSCTYERSQIRRDNCPSS